jgi:palmitoyltransferase ZDHHC9/14/18
MLILITYPLILGVSGLTLVTRIPYKHPIIVLAWLICTVGLIVSLALTAFRDPGILPRYEQPPASLDASSWRWSDRTHSYKPRGSYYDPDTGVIIEDFDHTCPWTGTAIGKKNLGSFHCFVALVFVCMVFDIMLLTDAF